MIKPAVAHAMLAFALQGVQQLLSKCTGFAEIQT